MKRGIKKGKAPVNPGLFVGAVLGIPSASVIGRGAPFAGQGAGRRRHTFLMLGQHAPRPGGRPELPYLKAGWSDQVADGGRVVVNGMGFGGAIRGGGFGAAD